MRCKKCHARTFSSLCAACKGECPPIVPVKAPVDYEAAEHCAVQNCGQCPFYSFVEPHTCSIDAALVVKFDHDANRTVAPNCPLKKQACYVCVQ